MLSSNDMGRTVTSDEAFQAACSVAHQLLNVTSGKPWALRPQDLLGLAFFPNQDDPSQLVCVGWERKSQKGWLPLTATPMLRPERMDDIVQETYAWMPVIIGSTLLVVFLVIAFAFSAVF